MRYFLEEPLSASLVAEVVAGKLVGIDRRIEYFSALQYAGKSGLAFFTGQEVSHDVDAGVLLVANTASASGWRGSLICTENPRLGWIKFGNWLLEKRLVRQDRVPAVIPATAVVHASAVVMEGVVLGKGVVIEPNAVIYPGVEIGDASVVRAGAVIGGMGFGYERDSVGSPIQMPHFAGVKVGRNVDVGANVCIARGVLTSTVIEDDVKIDNLVHIAHNCVVKKGAFIIACAELSGGVVVGENAWVAPGVAIKQKIQVGDRATLGIGAVVLKDVPPDSVVVGNPAKELKQK